ncbi:hypothetical protein OVA24_01895 [Luteolibacter sp. SL250]|uniref:DUF6580 family putative transport protein n=1 Tax=Luteolibacter sp. SL250 TaxID=2995170 RepID=UPI00226D4AFF|nr:DUF6580 family putative transport protein [Luteolibacter sp. SL250]WAC20130.1 hypothetical protein OVA24_01895 [Luteolibacter sp. SL250]
MNRWVPVLILIALLAVFRVLGSAFPTTLPNLQPLLALFLCSFIFLDGKQRWLVPGIVWVLTDPVTSALQGYPVFGWHHAAIALGIAATISIAMVVRPKPAATPVLTGAVASAVIFYFLTNLVSFLTDPLYTKDAAGFVQAQWTGPVGLGPTWVFLRNLIVANTLFTGLFLLARLSLPGTAKAPSQIAAR